MAWRARRVVSLLGKIRLPVAYYHCAACGQGHKPGEARWGLEGRQMTVGAEQVVALAGVMGSFEEGADRVLRTMAGLKVSASTVQRTAEAAGERAAEQLSQGEPWGREKRWTWHRDAQGRRCAYVSVDATGVRRQGPGGVRMEGRMAYVGVVYNPRGRVDEEGQVAGEARYLAGFYDLTSLGRRLQEQALAVGWAEAEQQIAISDGGSGLEEFFRTYFPKAECILDFWHAKEHLVELGQALFPQGEEERRAWVEAACHRLKEEGGVAVRQWLEGLDLEGVSGEAKKVHRRQVQYFRNHEHKMDYPRYIRNGWMIGSGAVESACKTVVGNRLKGGGMRWGDAGADAICHLRALFLSEPSCWEAFWNPHPPNIYLQN